MKHVQATRALFAATVLTLTGCAVERLHDAGMTAIARGQFETGIADLRQAAARDPQNLAYRLDLVAQREAAVQTLIRRADTARHAGQLDEAAVTYRRVLSIDAANDRAIKGLEGIDGDRRHARIVEEARKSYEAKDLDAADTKLRAVLAEDPGYGPAVDLEDRINRARGEFTVIPKLGEGKDSRVTLQFRDAPTKMVLEVLSRQTGINFILDKDVKSDGKTTIFVQNVPIEQAIDLVLDQNGLARQVLSKNMVLIYPNTDAKKKEYQQQIVHTFYLANAKPKDVEDLLKTVLNVKTMYVDDRSKMVVLRDSPDVVHMAEKLVQAIDVPTSEVMLEVQVLEIARSRLRDLGITYPSSLTATAASPSGGSGLLLSDLAHLRANQTGISSLAVTLNAMETAGLTNTLASPQIRVRNGEKAKILIGSRVPVFTNAVTPTATTAVVTGSIQYLDVGLTLNVQPQIHLDGEVTINIGLEVSSILNQITDPQSGSIAYQIGTRDANTVLELKDGETQILAGLIQDSDTRNDTNIPGLGDIPIVGRLFGSRSTNRQKSEIVLSITPHIVRAQTRPASDVTEFWYGSEGRTMTTPIGLTESEDGAYGGAAAGPQGPGSGTNGATARYAPSPRAGYAGGLPPMAAVSGGTPASTASPAAPASNKAIAAAMREALAARGAAAPPKPVVTLDGPAEVKVGQEFTVNLNLSSDQGLSHLHGQVRFDATAMQLISATAGDAIPSSAGSPHVDARVGGAQIDVNSTQEPLKGSGSLLIMRFKALAPRGATPLAAQVAVVGAGGIPAANAPAAPLQLAIDAP